MKHALILAVVLCITGCAHQMPQAGGCRSSSDGGITLTEERIGSPVHNPGVEP